MLRTSSATMYTTAASSSTTIPSATRGLIGAASAGRLFWPPGCACAARPPELAPPCARAARPARESIACAFSSWCPLAAIVGVGRRDGDAAFVDADGAVDGFFTGQQDDHADGDGAADDELHPAQLAPVAPRPPS